MYFYYICILSIDLRVSLIRIKDCETVDDAFSQENESVLLVRIEYRSANCSLSLDLEESAILFHSSTSHCLGIRKIQNHPNHHDEFFYDGSIVTAGSRGLFERCSGRVCSQIGDFHGVVVATRLCVLSWWPSGGSCNRCPIMGIPRIRTGNDTRN